MKSYFVDTESCGLYGVPVLLQFAVDDGPIALVDLWLQNCQDFLAFGRDLMAGRFIAHNINFDHQMISKWYNMCHLAVERYGPDHTMKSIMDEHGVQEVVDIEYESQSGMCLKPAAAVDTMILAAKGHRQSALMAAKPLYVRRVPIEYGQPLADELTKETDLPWILFARKKQNPNPEWQVCDRVDDEGNVDPRFVDVVLKFNPSNGLKDLHKFLFNSETTNFDDISPDEWPVGEGFCPYVAPLQHMCDDKWNYTNGKGEVKGKLWPGLIEDHINFWATNRPARKYGAKDITMLRDLYKHFEAPESDNDALLACQIASVRLSGFALDLDKMAEERVKSVAFVETSPVNVNSPKQVKEYIAEALDPMEQLIVARSANAETLEKIVKEFTLDEAEDCECDDQKFCQRCGGSGVVGPGPMEVAVRAKLIEEVRTQKKCVELYDKLLLAGRAYPNFRAVGTKSGRLSGTDGLNFQGIVSSYLVRSMFTLADAGEVLSGGDYDGQEVAIAGTTMNDDDLLDAMRAGKKIHGLFAAELFETTYEDILENKDEPNSRYGRGKSAVFLTIYGGTYQTMAQKAGVMVDIAEKAFTNFVAKFPGVGRTKNMITDRFSAIGRSDEGKMTYREIDTKYIESIFGFRRYFNTEFKMQKLLFDFCNKVFDRGGKHGEFISQLQADETKIVRDVKTLREQTMAGALGSALIGACYSAGNGVIRAANNHLIQSAGRTITVGLQEKLWSLQPTGIHPFIVRPMSVHDEVACVSKADLVEEVSDVVRQTLDEQCEIVPLLQMDWGRHLKSWGEMKKVNLRDYDAIHVGIDL